MKSKKLGRKGLWYKIKDIGILLQRNFKVELTTILCGILWMTISKNYPNAVQSIEYYCSDNRCSGIVSFLAIAIGIYVSVWSIFATSASKINEEILKNKIEGQLFGVIALGIFESLITIAFCVFIPNIFAQYTNFFLVFTTLSSISFIKFLVMLLRVTKLNLKFIVAEIDEQSRKDTEFLTKIDEIYNRMINSKK